MSNSGHKYEILIRNKLNEYGLISKSDTSSIGSTSDPDVLVEYFDTQLNIELKKSLSDVNYGQIEIVHDGKKFILSKNSKNEQFANSLKASGLESFLNSKWKNLGLPKNLTKSRGQLLTEADLKKDQETFKQFVYSSNNVPQNIAHTYYKNKGVSYIQIGGKGLYKIKQGPVQINKTVPIFAPELYVDVRIKKKSAAGKLYYSINAAVKASVGQLQVSKYNLEKDVSFLITNLRSDYEM